MTAPPINPNALAALTASVTADNGGTFGALLQPRNQVALLADATDLATALTRINLLIDALIAAGIMKPV